MKIFVNIVAAIFLTYWTFIGLGWLLLSGAFTGGTGLFGEALKSSDFKILVSAIIGWVLLWQYNKRD